MNIQQLKALLDQLTTPTGQQAIQSITKYFDLENELKNLPPDIQYQVLNKVNLFAACDAKQEKKDKAGNFVPKFSRFDVVHCDFTGVGYEWDAAHYAVIWDVYPHLDSIMVIPTTSQKRVEHANVFPVGQIKGLPTGNTTLLISDMTRVSRKRLSELTYVHEKHGPDTRVRLPLSWINRVNEAIAVTYTLNSRPNYTYTGSLTAKAL